MTFQPIQLNDPMRREEKNSPGPDQKDTGGPSRPDVSRPGRDDLLNRMKKVDPKQSEKYKQRTGQ